MNRKLVGVIVCLLVIVNLLLILLRVYPETTVSVESELPLLFYLRQIECMDKGMLLKHRKLAQWYNFMISSGIASSNPEDSYEGILNFSDGIMGYLLIPRTMAYFPIGHGAGEQVISRGMGHIPGTSLPIGGSGNHTELFGEWEEDTFRVDDRLVIYVLEDALVYRVTSVEYCEMAEICELSFVAGQDLCTLISYSYEDTQKGKCVIRAVRAEGETAPDLSLLPDQKRIPKKLDAYVALGSAFCVLLLPGITGWAGKRIRRIRKNCYCGSYTKKRKEIAGYKQNNIDIDCKQCYTQPIIQ